MLIPAGSRHLAEPVGQSYHRLTGARITLRGLSLATNLSGSQVIDLSAPIRPHLSAIITLLLHLLLLLAVRVGGHRQLALENLALRQQLAVYKRTAPRPRLHTIDRLFWVGLARAWTGWRQALVIVSPDTVLRWQRRRFREYWARLSRRPTTRRVAAEVRGSPVPTRGACESRVAVSQ